MPVASGVVPDDAVASPEDGDGSVAVQCALAEAFSVTVDGQSLNDAEGACQSIFPDAVVPLDALPTRSALVPVIENAPVLGSTSDGSKAVEAVSDDESTPLPKLPSASSGALQLVRDGVPVGIRHRPHEIAWLPSLFCD